MAKDYAFAVITYSASRLVETIHSIAPTERVLVVDNSQHNKPLGWAWHYATQRLCQLEGFKSVILCNDDIVLRDDTGPLLADALLRRQYLDDRPAKERLILLVSAYNIRDIDRGSITKPAKYGPQDLHRQEGDPPSDYFKPRWGTGPDFSCFATSMKMWELIGPPDLNFDPCYFEDNDIHHRLRLSGFEALSYAPYYHYGSQTIATDRERKFFIAERYGVVEAYYTRKWGGGPGRETFQKPFGR
jgi:GT2 family glycosyltransferase